MALAGSLVSGGSIAQTNTTLYGVLDLAAEWADAGLGSVTRIQSGGYQGSRFGFRGSEELGRGLKVVFVIEGGFGADTGGSQQGGRLFGRQSFLGLEGDWGSVTFGRQYSPHFWAFTRVDAFELGLSAGLAVITRTRNVGTTPTPSGLLTSYVTTGRTDNAVIYTSPVWKGFRVRGMVAPGEVPGSERNGLVWGAGAYYVTDVLEANIGYTTLRDGDGYGDLKAFSVGGSYAIGKARFYLGHTIDKTTAASSATVTAPKTEYALTNIGVRYEHTTATTTIAQFTRIADNSHGLTASRDGNVYGLGVQHELSRRTLVYASVGLVTNQNGSNYSLGGGLWLGVPAGNDVNGKSVIVGMRHRF